MTYVRAPPSEQFQTTRRTTWKGPAYEELCQSVHGYSERACWQKYRSLYVTSRLSTTLADVVAELHRQQSSTATPSIVRCVQRWRTSGRYTAWKIGKYRLATNLCVLLVDKLNGVGIEAVVYYGMHSDNF
jgi:hypothetical protein